MTPLRTSTRSAPPPSLWRRRIGLALLALLGAGFVEIHPATGGHPAGTGGDEAVFACSLEHGPRTHVERARPVERHDCAACLHRIHSRATSSSTAAAVVLTPEGRAAGGTDDAGLRCPLLDHAPSRGPPSA